MADWHRVTNVVEADRRGDCSVCGPTVKVLRKQNYMGKQYWRCQKRSMQGQDAKRRPYLKHKKDRCERCNFVPEHPCQLDVDHINGKVAGHEPENLQTLCANCHRLKTHTEGWDMIQVGR